MEFNSIEFTIFLPIVFLLYFIFPKKYRYIILLIASYTFYIWWNWKLVFLILGTTAISYLTGIGIKRTEKSWLKKLCLAIAISVSLFILIFFKYTNFIIGTLVDAMNAFGNQMTFNPLNIILPVGISFYTFQCFSYVIDIYREKIEPEKNPLYYALYVCFFPQLVAGPIERPNDLLPQLKNQEGINVDNLKIGLKMMLIGFIKKVAIADMVAVYVNHIYNDMSSTNGLLVVIGTVLFSIQILCDFSGYSDIAIGCAKLFNINLSKNFDKPYRSLSIKDFWNRWHITLSTWFRDYIYFPLGGSRCKKVRWCFNIFVVFLLSGLWHGAALTFIVWGLLHAIYRCVGTLTLPYRNKLIEKIGLNPESKGIHIYRLCVTYILVCLAWVAFRSNSLGDMLYAYRMIFTSWSFSKAYFENVKSVLDMPVFMIFYIVCAVVGLYFVDLIGKEYDENKMVYYVLRKCIYTLLALLVLGAFIYQKSADIESAFIYFQF